jgi:nucleotide-binding universal stress UspA family protein
VDVARTIMIGFDGSERATEGLALGALLADALDARPIIACVVQYPDHLLVDEELRLALEREAKELLDAAADRLSGREVETKAIIDESAARALHRLCEEEEPLLVALGSAHRGPVGRVLLGSVGEGLLSGAPCPIAVAPHGYGEGEAEPRLGHIGVAIDGSSESTAALRTAVALAERVRASLTVVAVAAPPHYGEAAAFAFLTVGQYESAEHQETRRLVDQAMAQVPTALEADSRVMQGMPAQLIAEAAEDFDLLLVGSRGYGPLRRTLLGSVSAKLMRSAPCPVLVLPRGAASDPLGLEQAR